MQILFGTPCAHGQVHMDYMQSVLCQTFLHPDRLSNQEKYGIALYQTAGYSGLAKDRGIIASFALRNGFDKILFADSDQEWSWPQLKALLDSDKKIIAGVVPIKKYPLQLNFTPLIKDKDCFADDKGLITAKGLARLYEKYKTEEIQVQCVGTGFLCIDISVLKTLAETVPHFMFKDGMQGNKIVQAWDFFQTGVVNNMYFGEDYGFCVQAKRAGFDVHIHAGVLIPHHGEHTFRIGQTMNFGEKIEKNL